jgi:hypothetical protein
MPKIWINNVLDQLKKLKGKHLLARTNSRYAAGSPAGNTFTVNNAEENTVTDSVDSVSITQFSDGRALKLSLTSALLTLTGYKEQLPNLYLASRHSPAYRDGLQLSAEAVKRTIRGEYETEDGESTYYDAIGPDMISLNSQGAQKNFASTNHMSDATRFTSAKNDDRDADPRPTNDASTLADNASFISTSVTDVIDDFNSDLYSLMSTSDSRYRGPPRSSSADDNMNSLQQGSMEESWASLPTPHRKKKAPALKPVAARLLNAPYGLPVDTSVLAKFHKAKRELPRFLPKALGGVGLVRKKMTAMTVRETVHTARSRSPVNGDNKFPSSRASPSTSPCRSRRRIPIRAKESVRGRDLAPPTTVPSQDNETEISSQEKIIQLGSRTLLFSSRYAAEDLFTSENAPLIDSETLDDLHQSNSFSMKLQAMVDAVQGLNAAYDSVYHSAENAPHLSGEMSTSLVDQFELPYTE